MNANAVAVSVAILTAMMALSMPERAQAGFPIAVPAAVSRVEGARADVVLARYRCHRRRYHLYSGVPDAPETEPVYPAPRTGVTFRKLFDAGYL